MTEYYYLDTCIWLNLFKKEKSRYENIDYNQIALDFLKNLSDDSQIIISPPILKELRHKLDKDAFDAAFGFFIREKFFFAKLLHYDYNAARRIESENHYQISFCDCFHVVFCKRLCATLITRDRKLIEIGNMYVKVSRPEDLR